MEAEQKVADGEKRRRVNSRAQTQTHQLREAKHKAGNFSCEGEGVQRDQTWVFVYQIQERYGSRSQETGSSPSSVPSHATLGCHSVFSSGKWVHVKIISRELGEGWAK